MNEYWNLENVHALERATNFPELARIALQIICRMPQPLGQVCGPISTGGFGSLERNLARFREAIALVAAHGYNVFNQMPFEEPMFEIRRRRGDAILLPDFYGTLFDTGLNCNAFFHHTMAHLARRHLGARAGDPAPHPNH